MIKIIRLLILCFTITIMLCLQGCGGSDKFSGKWMGELRGKNIIGSETIQYVVFDIKNNKDTYSVKISDELYLSGMHIKDNAIREECAKAADAGKMLMWWCHVDKSDFVGNKNSKSEYTAKINEKNKNRLDFTEKVPGMTSLYYNEKFKCLMMSDVKLIPYDKAAAQKTAKEIVAKELKENPFWTNHKPEFRDMPEKK